jgi:hypothetical protein
MKLALILTLAASAPSQSLWHPVPPETARAWLGFSGATLSIRSVDDPKRHGTARRRLTLTLPSGSKQSLPLRDGGGRVGNNALSLYFVGQGSFVLVSEKDCVRVDPFKAILNRCEVARIDTHKLVRVGRFDWMNGFDPPHGAFRLAFRFLPAWDT